MDPAPMTFQTWPEFVHYVFSLRGYTRKRGITSSWSEDRHPNPVFFYSIEMGRKKEYILAYRGKDKNGPFTKVDEFIYDGSLGICTYAYFAEGKLLFCRGFGETVLFVRQPISDPNSAIEEVDKKNIGKYQIPMNEVSDDSIQRK